MADEKVQVAFEIALAFVEAGNLRAALERLEKLGDAIRSDVRVLALKAQIEHGLGRQGPAQASLESALAMAPEWSALHRVRGEWLISEGKTREALATFNHALRLDLDDPENHAACGRVLLMTGNLPEAAYSFKQALKLNPEDAELQKQWALYLGVAGRFEEARSLIENVLSLQPNDATALAVASDVALRSERLADAETLVASSLRLAPDHPLARNVAARLSVAQGRVTGLWYRAMMWMSRHPRVVTVPLIITAGGAWMVGDFLDGQKSFVWPTWLVALVVGPVIALVLLGIGFHVMRNLGSAPDEIVVLRRGF